MVPMELYGTGPPKGYAVSNCSHQNQSCNPHKRLCWLVHKVFDHTNITTHSDHPIIWHGRGVSPPFPQLDQGRGQGEIWKLALSLRNSKFRMDIIPIKLISHWHLIPVQMGHFLFRLVWEILMYSWKEQFLSMKVCKNFFARIENYILA